MTARNPTVSVIINCHNCGGFLRDAIQSVQAQTYADWEVVFWDNASNDGSAEVAAGYGNLIRRYRSEKKLPLGAARNMAIEQAKGEYIALLDADDIWQPTKLARQMQLFDSRPRVGVVYTDASALFPQGDMRPFGSRPFFCRGSVGRRLFLYDFIVCSSIVIRKEVWKKLGGFEPNLTVAEEYDVLLRATREYEFDYVDEMLTVYRYHSNNSSWNYARMQQETKIVIDRVLREDPVLKRDMGTLVVRLRRGGMTCTPGEAMLLRGELREGLAWQRGAEQTIAAKTRVGLLMLLSLLPPWVIAALHRSWKALRRPKKAALELSG